MWHDQLGGSFYESRQLWVNGSHLPASTVKLNNGGRGLVVVAAMVVARVKAWMVVLVVVVVL